MMNFPDDDNGEVLRRLEANGDDLSRPRNIDFTVVFPNEVEAREFAEHFRKQGFSASVEFSQTVEGLPWDVIVTKHMPADYEEIGAFENSLQQVADPLGGRNDGWGCFSEP